MLEISGWCTTAEGGGQTVVEAVVAEAVVASAAAIHRPDVIDALGIDDPSRKCGFILLLSDVPVGVEISLRVCRTHEPPALGWRLYPDALPGRGPNLANYPVWLAAQKAPSPPRPPEGSAPGFSVILPVHDPDPAVLQECLNALRQQHYQSWEACVCDDASQSGIVVQILEAMAVADARFRVTRVEQNLGIAGATKRAIASARHDWLIFVDHDDRLKPEAIARLAEEISTHPVADILYTDEEKITENGNPVQPAFKPDWSPEYFRGTMYIGHLLCVRTSLVRQVGGPDPTFNGIQDYEMLLRLSEHTRHILHVPCSLYQWRMSPRSSALEGNVKGDMDRLQVAAVTAHLARKGLPGIPRSLGNHRVRLDPPAGYDAPAHLRIDPDQPEPIGREDIGWVVAARQTVTPLTADNLNRLLFFAERYPDSLVVPLICSADDRVAEADCTWLQDGTLVPLMRGFDPQSDGYNGSLSCHREIGATSGTVLVTSRPLWKCLQSAIDQQDSPAVKLSEAIARLAVPIIMVASAIAYLDLSLRSTPARIAGGRPRSDRDPYWNPAFDPAWGDYRLLIR